MAQAHQTAGYQAPAAAVVGCIDSRVPPELVFDQRIGDVFSARVAGNFVNTDILGSLEFATRVSGAKAIVVLGHTSCGAIRSAMAGVEMGNITAMLDNIRPALAAVTEDGQKVDPGDAAQVEKVTQANIRLAMEAITARSPIMRELVESGELKVAGAVHDLASGRVNWLT
jgi:carbonic anhydrase